MFFDGSRTSRCPFPGSSGSYVFPQRLDVRQCGRQAVVDFMHTVAGRHYGPAAGGDLSHQLGLDDVLSEQHRVGDQWGWVGDRRQTIRNALRTYGRGGILMERKHFGESDAVRACESPPRLMESGQWRGSKGK